MACIYKYGCMEIKSLWEGKGEGFKLKNTVPTVIADISGLFV